MSTRYQQRKARARELAIYWQCHIANESDYCWSWGWCIEWDGRWERIGRKYGLLREFKENGIL